MQEPRYYRSQAEVTRRLAAEINNQEAAASLLKMAEDYADIADDIENGAVEIRHAERMPQRNHAR